MIQVIGPGLDRKLDVERVLRSLPRWFGIEESLLMYVEESARYPTFAALQADRLVGFLTLFEHFPKAWEVHCVAVESESRGSGIGRALFTHCEQWLRARGASLLQVKTIAPTKEDPYYAETRQFYERLGYVPLEIFPTLWSPSNPCLQLVKAL